MKKIFIILIISFVGILCTYGQQTSKQLTGLGSVQGYLEYLPANYNSNSNTYPVIIFLHGSGERGNGSNQDLEKVKKHGPPKHIKNGHDMCFMNSEANQEECFIVLSPQQNTSQFGWNKDVVPFVDFALNTYRIDPERVYLTGLSMGGDGCWDGMRSDFNTTNRFAAVSPIAGKGMKSEGCTAGERAITVWSFHSDADTATTIQSHLQAINGYNECKLASTTAPIFTTYTGISHGKTWENAYKTDNSLHTPNLYEWFLTQRKSEQTLSISEFNTSLEIMPGDTLIIYSALGRVLKKEKSKETYSLQNFLKKLTPKKGTNFYIVHHITANGNSRKIKVIM